MALHSAGAAAPVCTTAPPSPPATASRSPIDAPEGVTVETVGRDDARLGKAGTPVDRVAAQAYSSFEKASVVTVPKETVLTEPIRIAVHGEGGTAFGHQVVELGAFAEAVVVIDHTGDAVLAANVDYVLGDGAKLTVVSVQDWDDKAVHVSQHNALIGRDASFKSVVVTFGGDLVRLHPRVSYAGTGGEAELFGLYFTDDGQHQEHRSNTLLLHLTSFSSGPAAVLLVLAGVR